MKTPNFAIACAILMILVLSAFPVSQGEGLDQEGLPTRNLLGYEETLNISLPKPSFYDSDDPHNGEDVEANGWEDIAFVVVIQSGSKVTKTENQGAGDETATCADIYQAVFVTLDGETVSTGTQQRIMVEDFTATWCTYCTGVIGAMNRLDLDPTMFPDKYIGIEWHSGGGTYGVGEPYSSALDRKDFYSLAGGIPRYVIDGMDPWVGGSSSANSSAIDDRIRNSISARSSPAPISLTAHAGHRTNDAWVEFTLKVESETFNNPNVEAHVILAQDAYPRRHGTNPAARLGWIGQDLYTTQVLQLEAPVVQLKEDPMSDDIGRLGHVEGDFEIQWQAEDKEDGTSLTIDLFYARGRGDWTQIAARVPNIGEYLWNTALPRVPDGDDYKLMVRATDRDNMVGEGILGFEFEINNPDPPTISVSSPSEDGEVMTGTGEIRWWSSDDEDDRETLTVDLEISSDLGDSLEPLAAGIQNTGSYSFDTMAFEDGTEYMIKLTIIDPKGLTNSTLSPVFTIFNNDPPQAAITFPAEGEKVQGTIEIVWDSSDEEDEGDDLIYDLAIMNIEDGIWVKLASSQPNTGSYTLDTTSLETGDGDYSVRIMLRDTHGEYSEQFITDFEIYNPDLPEILNTQTPRSPISGTAEFYYTLSDPDKGETQLLTVSIHISSDGTTWEPLGIAMPNTGTFYLETDGIEDGTYQLRISVEDPVLTGQAAVFIYPEFEVNNPDPPTISLVEFPAPGSNNTGEISMAWSGEDPDGDTLSYYLYYSDASALNWLPIYEAQGTTASSFIWNTSDMESGDYILKVIVKDGTKADLKAEAVTPYFHIHVEKEIVDDDNDDSKDPGTSGETDNSMLLVVLIVGILTIVLLLILGSVLLLVKRKREAAALPPPPMIGAPHAQGIGPGVSKGPLPPTPQPQQQLPPPQAQGQQSYIPPQKPL